MHTCELRGAGPRWCRCSCGVLWGAVGYHKGATRSECHLTPPLIAGGGVLVVTVISVTTKRFGTWALQQNVLAQTLSPTILEWETLTGCNVLVGLEKHIRPKIVQNLV